MVETAIYVALGALTSALLALLALPAVSRRAFRIAAARARLAGPLSAEQAQADRDALRGKHAVELALVERRAGEAEARWAKSEIALGRHAALAERQEAALAERAKEIAGLISEIKARDGEIAARDVEIGAREQANADALAQRDAANLQRDLWRARCGLAERNAEETQGRLAGHVNELATALTAQKHDAEAALAEAQERLAELEQRLEASEADAARLKRHATELTERFRARLSEAWDRRNELTLRVAALAQAHAETETALRAARAERDRALREAARLAEAEKAQAEGDERLRQTLARFGRDLIAQPPARPTLAAKPEPVVEPVPALAERADAPAAAAR